MLSQSPFHLVAHAAQQTQWRGCARKMSERKDQCLHVYDILPPTTIAGDVQRQVLGYIDLCLTSHRSPYSLFSQ